MPCARQRPPSERKVWFAKYAQRAPGSVAGRERDADVGAERVGLRGEHARVVARGVERDDRALVAAAGARRRRAERGEAGVDDEEQRAVRRAGACRGAASRARAPPRPSPPASEPTRTERGDGRRPAHAVGLEPAFALELAQRGLGLGAEDAVLAAGVEAERVEPALELARRRRRAASARAGRAAGRRARSRSRSSAPHVSGPQMPSTRRPRCVLELAHGALSVSAPNTPSSVTV